VPSSEIVFTLTEQWKIVTIAGQFDAQLSLGELVVTDRRGGIPMGSGPNIHVPLAHFPVGRWVTIEDKRGQPMPLLARWDGVAMQLKEGEAARSAATVEDRYHQKNLFALRWNELHQHPEGGFSIGLYRENGGEIRVLQGATNDMLTYPATAIPAGEVITLRARTGTALPVRVWRSERDLMAEWLPLRTSGNWDVGLPHLPPPARPGASTQATDAGAWKLLAMAASGLAATWLARKRTNVHEDSPGMTPQAGQVDPPSTADRWRPDASDPAG
jgi:hypothetical protein